jgi:hypothetical protein
VVLRKRLPKRRQTLHYCCNYSNMYRGSRNLSRPFPAMSTRIRRFFSHVLFTKSSTLRRQKVAIDSCYLKRDASCCSKPYKNLPNTRFKLRVRLRGRFASANILAKSTTKLCGEQQREDKEVVHFLGCRFLMAQCLVSESKDSNFAHLLLEILKPTIR